MKLYSFMGYLIKAWSFYCYSTRNSYTS